VKAAKEALRTGNVNLVLIWVQPKDEAALRTAFARTRKIRNKDKETQALADEYFFETAVRLHRIGEGEPYTGLTDEAPEDYVVRADNSLQRRSADSLLLDLHARVQHALDQQFSEVLAVANYKPDNVQAGREYVSRYVRFLHYVEALYLVASQKDLTHQQREARFIPTVSTNSQQTPTDNSAAVNRSFYMLLIAAFVVLGLLLMVVFTQQNKLRLKYQRHDFHDGLAQHLQQ
jgi:hypothetical protein